MPVRADGTVSPVRHAPQLENNGSHEVRGVPHWLAKTGLGSWYLIGIGLVVLAVVVALSKVTMVFIGVFLALVVTSVLFPMVDWMSRWIPRALATAIAIFGVFTFLGGLIFYVVYSVSDEWSDLANQFSTGADQIIDFLEHGPFNLTREQVTNGMRSMIDEGTKYVQEHAGSLVQRVLANASAGALIMTVLALALFITLFFLTTGRKMWLWMLNQVPLRNRMDVHKGATAGWIAFSGYARGTMIVAVSDGFFAFVLLMILGVPLAAPLGVLVMLGAFIPLVGAPAAMVVAMVVGLATGGVGKALAVGVGIALIGQFEGHVLQPLVMGRQVSLHPVVVAIGVAAGGFVGGLVGAVIAIPLIAVIWSVYRTLHTPDEPWEDIPQLMEETVLPAEDDELEEPTERKVIVAEED